MTKEENEERIAAVKKHGEEVVTAAEELGIDLDTIGEAYQGRWDSDEDFARETAESLGEIYKDGHWPFYCIDWEWAARELMMDYSEQDGYYFRNL